MTSRAPSGKGRAIQGAGPSGRPLSIALHTPLPGFGNELWDVLKLFFAVDTFSIHPEAQKGADGARKGELFPQGEPTSGMTPAGGGPFPTEQGDCGAEGSLPLSHTLATVEGQWQCRFTLLGQEARRSAPIPAGIEPERQALIYKRLQKRLCKLCLYDLCKKITGYQPPWGSLTGIRPTRLVYENMAQGLSLAESAAALVEDFDVAPGKAALLEAIVAVQQGLPQPTPEDVDIYLSIPFCRTRCAYCSFPGEALGSPAHVRAYLEALFTELEALPGLIAAAGLRPRALYIGGGTPTALEEADFTQLLQRTRSLFPHTLEYTVEAGRPDTITPGKLEALLRYGATRLSINPQTMRDETLARIGRHHTAAQTEETYRLARRMGFDNINMDVIAGLPGEREADFSYTMERIAHMGPDSLTVHTLALKRSSRLNLEGYPLPKGETAAAMTQLAEMEAQALGMRPYYLYRQKYMAGQQQNVGYARPGAECLYNIDIMEETTSILALGAGAISKRVFPDRDLRIERAPNVSNVALYIQRVSEMLERKARLFAG